MNAPGYNPMRWDCAKQGRCYNHVHRPKIEQFAEALPRRIGMSDIDAMTEVGGSFLFLEFKGRGVQEVPTGQRIAFERLTLISPKITVVVVSGDPQTMEIQAVKVIHAGRQGDWQGCTLEGLKTRIKSWAVKAETSQKRAA